MAWISVIVPIYNAEDYLHKCIDSVMKQSFADFELILINDGSTDSSAQICQRYAETESRVRYFSKENEGVVLTRLYGVDRAEGKFFTFVDADDYYASADALRIIFETINRDDCMAMQFGFITKYNHLWKKNKPIDRHTIVDRPEFIKIEYPKLLCNDYPESHMTPSVWNKVYNLHLRENLAQLRLTTPIFWGDDILFNLFLLENCESFSMIPDCLYIYRDRSGGTNRFSVNEMRDMNAVKEVQLQLLERRAADGDKDRIEKALFSEVTSWFYLYTMRSSACLPEEQARVLFEDNRELPIIRKAKAYYGNHPEIKWDTVRLLCDGGYSDYLTYANSRPDKSISERAKQLLKYIYKSV